MKTAAVLLLLLFLFIGLGLAQQQPVPITQEPSHHKIVDNEFTRAFYVEIAPGQQTLQHEHKNDYVYVTLGDSEIESIPAGKPPEHLYRKDGEVRYSKSPLLHVAKNLAKTPFRNITVEILSTKDAGEDNARKEAVSNNGFTYRVLIDNDKVRVTDCTLDAGATIAQHTHKLPHLAIPINEHELTDNQGHVGAAKPGNAKFVSAGVSHSLTNTSKNTAHFVVVEFK